MSAKTEKEVLVEYPIDIVYDTLKNIFPLKYYKLANFDDLTHTVKVEDSSNHFFLMHIILSENSPESTLIHFIADYPHAVSDIGSGGEKAIYNVLEGLLNELDKKPKAEYGKTNESGLNVEVVDPKTFKNPMKSKKDTKTIALGYILLLLAYILPIISFAYYDPKNTLLAFFAIGGVFCFCFALILSIMLQLSENSKSVLHGRIQTCLSGLWLIIAGFATVFIVSIGGILILAIIFIYFYKRSQY